jgi:hypothetical protein
MSQEWFKESLVKKTLEEEYTTEEFTEMCKNIKKLYSDYISSDSYKSRLVNEYKVFELSKQWWDKININTISKDIESITLPEGVNAEINLIISNRLKVLEDTKINLLDRENNSSESEKTKETHGFYMPLLEQSKSKNKEDEEDDHSLDSTYNKWEVYIYNQPKARIKEIDICSFIIHELTHAITDWVTNITQWWKILFLKQHYVWAEYSKYIRYLKQETEQHARLLELRFHLLSYNIINNIWDDITEEHVTNLLNIESTNSALSDLKSTINYYYINKRWWIEIFLELLNNIAYLSPTNNEIKNV